MAGIYYSEKVKREQGFQTFFLVAIILHSIIFFVLNLHKVKNLDVAKEAILKFSFVKLPPPPEAAATPKEAPPVQRTEVKMKSEENIQQNIPKAFKEDIKPMEAMQVDERDLLRERLSSSSPPPLEEFSGGAGRLDDGRIALPSAFGHRGEGVGGSGSGSSWGVYEGEGKGEGDEVGGFGKKKTIERYSYGQMAFKQLISNIPDWVEKSNKIIITAIRVWIAADGKVMKAEVSKSSGYLELDQLALDSIRKREFAPSKDGNMRIAVIEIDFTNIR